MRPQPWLFRKQTIDHARATKNSKQVGVTYSLPLRLYNHAISSNMLTTNPGLFFFSISFRRVSSFSANGFPAYFWSSTINLLLGRSGRAAPQTSSIKFLVMPRRPDPPFFLMRVSRPLACSVGNLSECYRLHMERGGDITSRNESSIDADSLATFGLVNNPTKLIN